MSRAIITNELIESLITGENPAFRDSFSVEESRELLARYVTRGNARLEQRFSQEAPAVRSSIRELASRIEELCASTWSHTKKSTQEQVQAFVREFHQTVRRTFFAPAHLSHGSVGVEGRVRARVFGEQEDVSLGTSGLVLRRKNALEGELVGKLMVLDEPTAMQLGQGGSAAVYLGPAGTGERQLLEIVDLEPVRHVNDVLVDLAVLLPDLPLAAPLRADQEVFLCLYPSLPPRDSVQPDD